MQKYYLFNFRAAIQRGGRWKSPSGENKSLTIKNGQTHMQRDMQPLFDKIEAGEIDPSFIITREMPLEDAPLGDEMFKHKQDGCIKVALTPGRGGRTH